MQKWEYKCVVRELDADEHFNFNEASPYVWWDMEDDHPDRRMHELERLARLGNEGWELVAILHEENTYANDAYAYYPRRAVS